MQHETTMNSDMASELREQMARPDRELGFYLVASNRELLNHMEGFMNRCGIFGVMDSNGRVHYLVDARKGTPLAARNIMATAQNVISRHLDGARTARTHPPRSSLRFRPKGGNREAEHSTHSARARV